MAEHVDSLQGHLESANAKAWFEWLFKIDANSA